MSTEHQSNRENKSKMGSESVPFCKVLLHVWKDGKELFEHKADLDIATSIHGLKEELKEDGHIKSSDQVWYLDNIELQDDKTLAHYEITGANKIYRDPIRIIVKVNTLS